MCFIGLITVSAQYLNSMGNVNWERFATQNYFDGGGVFMGILVCAPLLVDAIGLLISLVFEAMRLVVQVKVKELEAKRAKEKRAEKKGNPKKKENKKTK